MALHGESMKLNENVEIFVRGRVYNAALKTVSNRNLRASHTPVMQYRMMMLSDFSITGGPP